MGSPDGSSSPNVTQTVVEHEQEEPGPHLRRRTTALSIPFLLSFPE